MKPRLTFPQPWLHFDRYAAVIAMICLLASACVSPAPAAAQSEMPFSQDLNKYPGLLPELEQLFEKFQHSVQFPPPRTQSRLLPLLPESTSVYLAFPNYGEAVHQAQAVLRQELQESLVLREWWRQYNLDNGQPVIDSYMEKVYLLSQYVGDEVIVSGTTGGRDANLLILAEVQKPGLKDFLRGMTLGTEGNSLPKIQVFDPQELATARDAGPPQSLVVLVRPDFVVASLKVSTLRTVSSLLDSKSREFASSPFGQRLQQEYQGGATILAGADFQKILPSLDLKPDVDQILRRTGFGDMKYLVWEHKSTPGQAASEAELSFTGPRRGVASWLAAPAPLGSLEFVSPNAAASVTVMLKNLGEIFDDIKELSAATNPNALNTLAQGEAATQIDLKRDLLTHLTGEITVETETPIQPEPVWKLILKIDDAEHVQQTLSKLLAIGQFRAQQFEEDGIIYHSVRVPSPKQPVNINYAFVDGYLIVASSHETLAESIRLRKTGESLPKSDKFLSALPPGHTAEASAIFYTDAAAMNAMRLTQLAPTLAGSLSHLSPQKSVVACVYGEESAIREVSASGGVDAAAALVGAAIAIPNLMRARIAANESSAVGAIRTIIMAQGVYIGAYPQRGYARDLASLGPDPHRGAPSPSADHLNLVDGTLGNTSCTAGAWCIKNGYKFTIVTACKNQPCKEFVVMSTPVSGNAGSRNFCSTSDGVVRSKVGPPLAAPISAMECRTWRPAR